MITVIIRLREEERESKISVIIRLREEERVGLLLSSG